MTTITATNEELKEYFLCGMRTGFASKKETLRLNSHLGEAYNCAYCSGWHKIPAVKNEADLISQAKAKFNAHVENVFSHASVKTSTIEMGVLTSSIVVLGEN